MAKQHMSVNMLTARNLCWSADGHVILSDISFTVRSGEYISIVGPNGAGKTTLLRCLAGLLRPDNGRVDLKGKPLHRYDSRARARIAGYVPQVANIDIPFSVMEFVLLSRYPHLSPFTELTAEDRAAAERALDITDAAAFKDRAMTSLSGGERQRIFIAAALAQDAEILLLDEPTTFLDYRHQWDILELLARLHRESGLTVISVLHDLNAALHYSDRILALQQGRCAFLGTPDQCLAAQVPEKVYGIPFRSADIGGRTILLAAHTPAENVS